MLTVVTNLCPRDDAEITAEQKKSVERLISSLARWNPVLHVILRRCSVEQEHVLLRWSMVVAKSASFFMVLLSDSITIPTPTWTRVIMTGERLFIWRVLKATWIASNFSWRRAKAIHSCATGEHKSSILMIRKSSCSVPRKCEHN